ncbi:S-adenosylmethionine-dependent nucleotide dehydratase RSAD2-like [Diorhabda sublineata]|uniref:S-adenosylmethionine-dependent nucleotide dehydratase RSAD2-like n=1 Tax=Diorhabda sublineata TaxID=1163346 RepID=UPI0024E094E0|nr:S-adenosylmethionine-dependent nucleotide dehydratase RSAD2-like [Diorhabda sublineata]
MLYIIFLIIILIFFIIKNKIIWMELRNIIFSEQKDNNDRTIPENNMKNENLIPTSVNYHFTRLCNYECGFCFHTAKTSFMLNLEDAKKGLKMLEKAGMKKINFSGGEPFLPNRGKHLGEMVKYCKKDLKLESVTIVSNGSLIKENWFEKYGEYLDIIAISCDSFNEETNKIIGRGQKNKNHVDQLMKVQQWCQKYDVLFKINTVVNTYNQNEDMSEQIIKLNPIRWKVFQCLLLEGENVGPDALRNAERFYISESEFNEFLERHKKVECLVPESNTKMQNSYLILDEYLRFLDCTSGSKRPSKSILDIGVSNALKFSGFDEGMFKKRGGIYKWSKEATKLDW